MNSIALQHWPQFICREGNGLVNVSARRFESRADSRLVLDELMPHIVELANAMSPTVIDSAMSRLGTTAAIGHARLCETRCVVVSFVPMPLPPFDASSSNIADPDHANS